MGNELNSNIETPKETINKGRIILLNGVSSSGKTTLSKALIKTLPSYFHLSIDNNYWKGWWAMTNKKTFYITKENKIIMSTNYIVPNYLNI
jgi:chloramphenicol 3-O-phosphotransferase